METLLQERTHYIYVLQDQTGEIRYVGQTIDISTRYKHHLYEAKVLKAKTYKNFWVNRCLQDNQSPLLRIIQIVEGDAMDTDLAEMYWIARYKKEGARLTNGTLGGRSGIPGYVKTPEVIAKVIKFHTGRKRSVETRAKIAAKARGRIRSEESCRKQGESNKGSHRSAEARAKMSAKNSERWNNPEFRARMTAKMKLRCSDPNWRRKQAERMTGFKHKPETIEKLKQSWHEIHGI